jgi:O-antigen/teichoic acid export membrane protein
VHRSALFSISVIISTVIGIFSIPIINAQVGGDGFAMLTLAQAIMAFMVVVMAFGWGATGPSMVSALSLIERKPFFVASLRIRLVLCGIGVPVAFGLLTLLTTLTPLQAALAAVAYSMPAVGAAWYLVGTNRPVALFLFDGLPPLLGQIAGLVALLLSPDLTSYLLCVGVANVCGAVASWCYVAAQAADGPWSARETGSVFRTLRDQVPGVLTMSMTSLWSALPIVLVNQFAPAALPEFAIIDKLYKYAVIVLAPILQAVQSWVPERGRHETPGRARTATVAGWLVGTVGGICLAVLGPLVAPLISLGHIEVTVPVALIVGIAFVGEAAAQISGLSALVALGRADLLASSSLIATLSGIGLVVGLVVPFGVLGAVIAMSATTIGLSIFRTHATWHAARPASALREPSAD